MGCNDLAWAHASPVLLRTLQNTDRWKYVFLHEHPAYASSWEDPEMKLILDHPNCYLVTGHMCQFGMKNYDEMGEGHLLKPTKFMTNNLSLANELAKICDYCTDTFLYGASEQRWRRYTPEDFVAILRGIRNQLQQDQHVNKDGTLSVVVHDEDLIAPSKSCPLFSSAHP